MSTIAIALMGFFAFSGTPAVPVEAPTTDSAVEVSANAAIAQADKVKLARAEGEGATFTVLVTSYNAVPEQTDSNPSITASGAATNPEVIAARSVDLAADLPFGTVIALERTGEDSENCHYSLVEPLIGYRVVADSMHSRKRQQIDVLLDAADTVLVHGKETNPSIALGMCKGVTITVLGRIKVSEIPSSQEELRKIVEGGALAVNY